MPERRCLRWRRRRMNDRECRLFSIWTSITKRNAASKATVVQPWVVCLRLTYSIRDPSARVRRSARQKGGVQHVRLTSWMCLSFPSASSVVIASGQ